MCKNIDKKKTMSCLFTWIVSSANVLRAMGERMRLNAE